MSGPPNDEVYVLERGQRYRERKIREAKRELRGAQLLYERDKSAANLDAMNKARQKLSRRQEKMREYIDGANAKSKTGRPVLHRKPDREWAGDMPKAKMPASANRTLSQLLGAPSARRAMAGLDRRAVTAAVGEEMARRGGTVDHFRSLSPGEQQMTLRRAIASIRAKANGTAKASRGAHFPSAAAAAMREVMVRRGIPTVHANRMAAIIEEKCVPEARNFLVRHRESIAFGDLGGVRRAHYDPEAEHLNIDIELAALGRSTTHRRPRTSRYSTRSAI